MALKNSKTVALERRYDLSTLFCMIGRHGPAVAMAIIAMLSVLAAFIIYRTVRGQRRKATAAADNTNILGAKKDAAVGPPGQLPSQEGSHHPIESTGELQGEMEEEDVHLIQGQNLETNDERCAAAAVVDVSHTAVEERPGLSSPPESCHLQGLTSQSNNPDYRRIPRDDAEETAAARQCHQCDSDAVNESGKPKLKAEDAEDLSPCDMDTGQDETVKDAEERGREHASRQREEEICDYKSGQEEEALEMACKAEDQEVAEAATCQDEDMTTDRWVPYEKTKREEDDFQCTMNELLARTPRVEDDDGLQCKKTKEDTQSAMREILSRFPQVKDDDDEEENEEGDWHQEYSDDGDYRQDALLLSEEKEKDEMEECVEYQIIAQQAEIWTPLPEQLMSLPLTELPSSYEQQLNEEQNQCEKVAENMTPPNWDGAEDDNDGEAAGHIIEEDIHSETVQVSDPPRVMSGPHLPSFCQQLQSEATDDEENCGLPSVADQLKERSVTCDDDNYTATHDLDEDGDGSTLVLLPSVNQPHTSEPENDNDDGNGKDCVPAVVIYEDGDIPSVTLSSYQQLQMEQKEDNGLNADDEEENGLPLHGPHLPSLNQEELSGKRDESEGVDGDNVTALVRDEDGDLPTYDPHLPSFGQEPLSQQQVDNDDSNVSSPTVDEDSGISSKIFSPHLLSTPQSQDFDDEDMSAPITDEDWDLLSMALEHHLPSVYQQQQCGQDIIDMSVTVVNEENDHPSMVFGSYLPSSCHQPHSDQSDKVTEPFGANNEVFGQAVQDSYYREFDEFSEQTAASSITNFTDELNKQTEMKDTAEPLEVNKKKAGGSIDEKGRTQAKVDEEEEAHEKTEINIMEATMDNNEWITDGNSKVLPWMSFSLTSYAQSLTKTNQLPTEEPQHNPASTTAVLDAISPDKAEDTTPLSLLDEDAENNKKVATVQPMLQNVSVTFRVHYLTHSPGQMVAVTGNQRELGNWKDFIPLESAKDGYWASVISLPAESQVEWKFVLVDEGKIRRWEECENHRLDTGHGDDVHVHKWWGFL